MKRNQFSLTVIRLLVNAMFFYVLGIGVSNYINNNTLLIDMSEAVVSPTHTENVEPVNIITHFDLFSAILPYTYVRKQAIAVRTMNTYIAYSESIKTNNLVEKSINLYARVPNYQLDKPPRGDTIEVNTS
jgi:hypothetical protein